MFDLHAPAIAGTIDPNEATITIRPGLPGRAKKRAAPQGGGQLMLMTVSLGREVARTIGLFDDEEETQVFLIEAAFGADEDAGLLRLRNTGTSTAKWKVKSVKQDTKFKISLSLPEGRFTGKPQPETAAEIVSLDAPAHLHHGAVVIRLPKGFK